jgi:hypothetical protein
VNDALVVCGFEGFAKVLRNIQGFLNRDRTALDAIRKRFAVDKFEYEVARTLGFQKIVDWTRCWGDSAMPVPRLRAENGLPDPDHGKTLQAKS